MTCKCCSFLIQLFVQLIRDPQKTIRYISVNTRYINTGKEKSCMKGEQENIDTYTSYYLYAYINTYIHTNMYICTCMYTIYIIHNLKI